VINLVFGQFNKKWAWRVEWKDDNGKVQFKDFVQKDMQPGVAKAEADAFKQAMMKSMAA
jgi:hypothetical protein